MSMPTEIDWRAAIAGTDLRRLIEDDLGAPDRAGRWVCPFHAGAESPNLSIGPDGRHWRCWSGRCALHGDAIDWLVFRDGVTRVEAARVLLGIGPSRSSARPSRPSAPAPESRPAPAAEAWRDEAWRREVDRLIRRAEDRLWSAAGRAALDWLRGRGLRDAAIRAARLGFVDRSDRSGPIDGLGRGEGPGRITLWRGVTIPWPGPGGAWVGLNVRHLGDPVDGPVPPMPDGAPRPKYRAAAGSRRGFLYPSPAVGTGLPLVLVEGEFDALLAGQELRGRAEVRTVGSASTGRLERETWSALADPGVILVATDNDPAGIDAALALVSALGRRARWAEIPAGKDLSEFHAAGGDLRSWLDGILGPPPPPPFDPATWIAFDDPDDIAESEARRLERAGLI